MSFRQRKLNRTADDRAWHEWIARHGPTLRAEQFPPGLTLSESHLLDYLENGYLQRHPKDNDGFSLEDLSASQLKTLISVLEASPQYADHHMLDVLRTRLAWQP